jgi:hypothetical protein
MEDNLTTYLTKLLYLEDTIFQVQKLQVSLRLKLATTVQICGREHLQEQGYQDLSVGFNLFTGDPGPDGKHRPNSMIDGFHTYDGEHANDFRLGAAYFGYQNYRFGFDSESIRNAIQNKFAHDKIQHGQDILNNPYGSKHFGILSNDVKPYINYQTRNPFTTW